MSELIGRRRMGWAGTLAAIAGLALTGCSGDDEKEPTSEFETDAGADAAGDGSVDFVVRGPGLDLPPYEGPITFIGLFRAERESQSEDCAVEGPVRGRAEAFLFRTRVVTVAGESELQLMLCADVEDCGTTPEARFRPDGANWSSEETGVQEEPCVQYRYWNQLELTDNGIRWTEMSESAQLADGVCPTPTPTAPALTCDEHKVTYARKVGD
jgi:hypothetical protein